MPLELKEALGDAFTDIDLTKGVITFFLLSLESGMTRSDAVEFMRLVKCLLLVLLVVTEW